MTSLSSTLSCKNCSAFNKSAFYILNESQLALLQKNKKVLNLSRGDKLNVQGTLAENAYCVSHGSSKVTISKKNSQPSVVRLASSGDMLGYRCLFSEETYRGTATSLEDMTVCKIHKSFIFRLIESDPNFSKELLKRMGQEIAMTVNHHHSFSKKNVRERTAEFLLILKKKASTKVSNGWRIDTPLTRHELANWIGTAKETLIRCLSDFKKENLIDQEDHKIVILNQQGLVKVIDPSCNSISPEYID